MAWLPLFFLAPALATQVGVGELPCPLGGAPVKVYSRVSGNTHGGFDSDTAAYSTSGQFRTYKVATCPDSLFSLYGTDMTRPLDEADRAAATAALAQAKVGLSSEPAVWERYGIAAAIYEALGADLFFLGDLWLEAAWTARDEAVGVYLGLQGPQGVVDTLAQGDVELAKELPPDVRRKVLYNLARVAHRGGYITERDSYLSQLEASPGLEQAEIEAVARMRRAGVIEAALQDRAIEVMIEALRADEIPVPLKARTTYLLADTLRRRGRYREAAPLYALVLAEERASDQMREMALVLSREIIDHIQP